MKRFATLVLVLLMLCAAGCKSAPSPATDPAETTEPALTARELYWKMRSAIGMNSPTCYIQESEIFYETGSDIFLKKAGSRDRMQVIYGKDPYEINIAYEWTEFDGGEEFVTRDAQYYREKEDGVDLYWYSGSYDQWIYLNEEGLDRWVLELGRVTLHPTEYPENATVDPETQMVGDREVYVLRYREPFAKQVPEAEMTEELAILNELEIENRLYIDTETYLLLQAEISGLQLEGEQARALYAFILGEEYMNKERKLTVTSYAIAYRNIRYDPVEVPPVPNEAFQGQKDFGNT